MKHYINNNEYLWNVDLKNVYARNQMIGKYLLLTIVIAFGITFSLINDPTLLMK